MFNWFRNHHGVTAISGAAVSVFALAQQAMAAGLIHGRAAVILGAIGAVVAAFAQAPGTPKE